MPRRQPSRLLWIVGLPLLVTVTLTVAGCQSDAAAVEQANARMEQRQADRTDNIQWLFALEANRAERWPDELAETQRFIERDQTRRVHATQAWPTRIEDDLLTRTRRLEARQPRYEAWAEDILGGDPEGIVDFIGRVGP